MTEKFQVKVLDVDDWRAMIKCQDACPVNTDARGYVTAMARRELELGFEIAHDPNPLSTVCGRICGAPCEIACRRGDIDDEQQAIAIRPIKRVLTERFGPEAEHITPDRVKSDAQASVTLDTGFSTFSADLGKAGEEVELPGTGAPSLYSTVRWSRKELMRLASQAGHKAGKIAIIGAGPTSLAVAHDLVLLGHKVTIYEAGPKTGGMMRYGVQDRLNF